jgi:hypothetical protein
LVEGGLRITRTTEDDWTPVARSTGDPVAVIVLPDESFELEDLRELARAFEQAGLPVLIAERAVQRRVVPLVVVPVVIHFTPALQAVLVGVAGSAAWDGIKVAFARIRFRGERTSPSELNIDVQIHSDRLIASAKGPATEALTEVARKFVDRAAQSEG